MKLSDAFPSKYLKESDIVRPINLKISRVEIEEIGQGSDKDTKPVLYFNGAKKGLALNKTNGFVIAQAYGDELDDWLGRVITLYSAETTFAGKVVPCIRVKVPVAAKAKPAPEPEPEPEVFDDPAGPEDAEVPF